MIATIAAAVEATPPTRNRRSHVSAVGVKIWAMQHPTPATAGSTGVGGISSGTEHRYLAFSGRGTPLPRCPKQSAEPTTNPPTPALVLLPRWPPALPPRSSPSRWRSLRFIPRRCGSPLPHRRCARHLHGWRSRRARILWRCAGPKTRASRATRATRAAPCASRSSAPSSSPSSAACPAGPNRNGHAMWERWIPFWRPGNSQYAGDVDLLFAGLTAVSVLIAALLFYLLLSFCIRYRANSGADRGDRITKSWRWEIGWTTATLVAFLALFAWGASLFLGSYRMPDDALPVYI